MLNKKQLKIEIKNVKKLCKDSENLESLHNTLDEKYERISNRQDKDYSDKYNVIEILRGKTLKEFEILKSKNGNTAVIIEFIEYLTALNGFVFIYNEFKDNEQTVIDIYVLKQGEDNDV